MRYGRSFRAVALVALIAAVGVALPACGGGGSPGGKNSKDLFLQKMLLIDRLENTDITQSGPPTYNDIGGNGTTNAYRDSKILMVFNAPVDFNSVDNRTIRIGIPTGNNLLVEALGRFEPVAKKPNWVLFNPTYKSSYDPANPDREPDNPFAFDGNAVYSVIIPSVATTKRYLQNRSGDPIVKDYFGEFATSNEYIQTYTQPEIVETNPLNGAIEVDATSDVDMTFSEPMKPSSFRLGDTVIVRNTDTDRDVLGTLRFSADARTVSFRPVFGYGPGPYNIFVRVKTDVTNLAGNNIPKEVRIQFRTERDDTVATLIDIRETFDTNDYEDKNFASGEPRADWNRSASGYLAGLYGTGTTTYKTTTTYLYIPWDWGQSYAGRTQTIWQATEVAPTPRTLTGFDWYYQASGSAATVTNVTINLGHHEPGTDGFNPVGTNFTSNFKDNPVTVVSNLASYNIPLNTATGSWLAGPTFTKNFKYNGSDNLLFELYVTCDTFGLRPTPSVISGAWGFKYGSYMRTVVTQPTWWGAAVATYNYAFDVRWYWLVSSAEAQSLFYDTEVKSPTYLASLIDPSVADQPAGTTTSIFYQGAPDDIDNPGSPDYVNVSEWVEDLEKLSGYRYIRFNVLMQSNLSTGQAPLYNQITFPFYFF